MIINTRDFGKKTISEDEIIKFVQPIYGFEDETEFVLLQQEEFDDRFAWLQSVQNPQLCFILADPSVLPMEYSVNVPNFIAEKIGGENFECWVIAVIPKDFSKSTVNLKSPVIINPKTKFAAQIIAEEDYPIRFPLMQQRKEKATC